VDKVVDREQRAVSMNTSPAGGGWEEWLDATANLQHNPFSGE
jgi:hypothetical protein